jgi:hypothetical protein
MEPMTKSYSESTTPGRRGYLFECAAIAFVLIASGAAGFLLGGLR